MTDPAPNPTPTVNNPPAETEDGQTGNAEAAKYRRRLRDTETERDAFRTRVEAMQRREVSRLADRLAQPDDLFTIGAAELPALLNEHGDVDPDKVTAAVAVLVTARPGLAKAAAARFPDLGQGTRDPAPSAASWSEVIKGRAK